MTEEAKNNLKKIVNSSGFPLQIGLKHAIKKTNYLHGWRVLLSEHPWRNNGAGNDGFIDLVLIDRNDVQIIVIECKRVRETNWIFLNPSDSGQPRRHARFWMTEFQGTSPTKEYFDWKDGNIDPASPESEFCAIPGQDKSKPMLERISAEIVDATEALALEESHVYKSSPSFLRAYFSMIVTTAEIQICKFDPNDISLNVGDINNSDFDKVPFVRFRKSLTTRPQPNLKTRNLSELVRAKERTVFVVNSSKLIDLLTQWKLENQSLMI